MIIIFPWGGNFKFAKNIEKIIEGKDYNKLQNYNIFQYLIFLIKLIIIGPFITRERYRLINFSTQLYMFIFALYPLVLKLINHQILFFSLLFEID